MTDSKQICILLVEDNEDHVALVSRAFSKANDRSVNLLVANSIASAQQLLKSASPTVILSDYLLPDGDGLELLHCDIEGNAEAPPFVLLTSQGDEKVAVEAMKAGATDYIIKSETSLMSLPDICRSLIREYDQRKQRIQSNKELAERQRLNDTLLSALPYPAMLIRGHDRVVLAANKIALEKGAVVGAVCWQSFGTNTFNCKDNYNGTFCSICKGKSCLFENPHQSESAVSIGSTMWDVYWVKVTEDTYLHYAIEVTERHSMQKDIERLLAEQQAILDTSVVGITKVINRIQVWVNKAMSELFGYSLDELNNAETSMLYSSYDDFIRLGEEAYPMLADGKTYNTERLMRRKDGSSVWVQLQGRAIAPNNPVAGSVWVFQNITHTKLFELNQREQLTRMEIILDNLPMMAWLKDAQGHYELVNKQFTDVTGLRRIDVIGKTDFDLWPEELARKYREDDQDVLSTKSRKQIEESDQDESRSYITYKTAILNELGEAVGTTGVSVDISDFKKAEHERIQLQEQLNKVQRLESVGRLAGGVAHDFNNKLSVILGYAELAKICDHSNCEECKEYIDEIIQAGQYAKEITRRLLTFSRSDSANPVKIDPNIALNDIRKTLGRMIGEHINLSLDLQPDAWPVRIDPTQFDQIITNLVVNARDAMPDGGVVTLATVNVVIEHDLIEIPDGEYVLISCSDTGCGMDSNVLDQIFEPFFTTKKIGEGTGLGLSSVYGIVRQNNGYITVQSEPGKGAMFSVFLPRMVDVAPNPSLRSAIPERVVNGTILLIEDEEPVRRITKLLLENIGYMVIAADSPKNAIEICVDNKVIIHCVLSDVVMPGMNCKDMYEQIRSIRPNLPFVFFSGYSEQNIKDYLVMSGVKEIIKKPLNYQQLKEKIAEALQCCEGHLPQSG